MPVGSPRFRPSSISEITLDGTLKPWAEQLGVNEAVSLLDKTLEDTKKNSRQSRALAGQ
jgi:ferritin-like metal-binding protein YciE